MSSAPRVVHLTSVHPASDPRIFVKECRTLAASGYDVHLIAPDGCNEVRDGVHVWGLPARASSRRAVRMTRTVAQLFRLARALDADVYHFHDPELMPAGLVLARSGARVIYDAHESVPDDILLKEWIRPRLRRPIASGAAVTERAASRRFAAVVAATPSIGDRFAGYGARSVVVSNFPEPSAFAWPATPGVRKERVVCYVGSISELRGARLMVDAMADVDAKLLLAGRFSPPELREDLAARRGWERVVELGQIGPAELATTLERARAGLAVLAPVPTFVVAQPTKVYEYMAAGVPAIASDFPGWRAIVADNECGICVDPTDPLATARAVEWILDHPQGADAMGRNGRRAVERRFRWGAEGDRLLSLYEEVLRESGDHTRRNRSSATISKT